VFQALSSRQEELRGIKKLGRDTGRWLRSLSAFASRLRWRSHFVQKLSDQPSIEHDNMCRAYDVLRTEHDQAKLDAWTNGLTGFPMVMRNPCTHTLHASPVACYAFLPRRIRFTILIR
jgi:deoxyribodipyrimidine photo-lyase